MSTEKKVLQKPIISVIIPAYNVEPYIEQCIKSIECQTLKNIEIIIVDDGSIDSTASIVSRLYYEDNRIKLIKQNNSGVSEARNKGLEQASGDYVTFIDADDFIESDFLDYMMHLIKKDDSDFALSLNCFTKKGETQVDKEDYRLITPEKAVALLLSPRIIVGCWNKIYRRVFLVENKIKFSTDLFYGEGLYFITMVAQKANHVAVGNHKAYYYRRNNQTSATTKFKIESIYNGEISINKIRNDLKINSSDIEHMLLLHQCMYSIGAAVKLEENHEIKDFKCDYDRWLTFVRKNICKIISYRDVSLYRKLLLLGGCICPKIMAKLDMKRKKLISDKSVE